jgi:phosphoribosylanthranilate isomerase
MEKLAGLTIIKEIVVEKNASSAALSLQLNEHAAYCDYFLLDFSKSGIQWSDLKMDASFDLDGLKPLFEAHKIILALDFEATETQEVLEKLAPFALSIGGGVEEKIGLKSFEALDEILDQLELTV